MPILNCLIAFSSLATPAAGLPGQGGSTVSEVPFRTTETAIIVDAVANGRQISAMFDTGFSGVLVLDSSVDLGPASGSITLRDFVGELQAKTVKLKTLTMGGRSFTIDDKDIVQQPGAGSEGYGVHIDGIMGFSVIKNYVTEINFQKKKFVFYPNSVDISKRVPDNKKTFLLKMLPLGGTSIELQARTANDEKMTLALDTGNSFYATTHKDVLERVGLWTSGKKPKYTRLSGVASGAVESWSMMMPPLTIFGVPVQKTIWDIIDLPSSSAEGDGTVGFGFLKNFNITIDYARRRVWLENFQTPIENEERSDIGLSAGYDRRIKRTVVYLVSPESPAALAGIKEGDHVLSVDGKDLNGVGFNQFRKLMTGDRDSEVKLAISRNGALKRYTLKRVPLYNE